MRRQFRANNLPIRRGVETEPDKSVGSRCRSRVIESRELRGAGVLMVRKMGTASSEPTRRGPTSGPTASMMPTTSHGPGARGYGMPRNPPVTVKC
jgi:hypothetical protein